jgi:hypothetical protein
MKIIPSFMVLISCFFLAGCFPVATAARPISPTDTTLPAIQTQESISASTETILPVLTTVVSPTETVLPGSPVPQTVQIYLIAIADNGISGKKIGCDDSVVPVTVEIPPIEAVLRAAINQLLQLKSNYYGESGLYNALYQSDLKVESISLNDGIAEIYLTGSMMLGGECDNPRVEAQLTETALQFSTVKTVTIYINGKLLKDALSLK